MTSKQFFSNENLIAMCGGNYSSQHLLKEKDFTIYEECPICHELFDECELKADGCCDRCFIKQDAKRIEEDNNKWLKEN